LTEIEKGYFLRLFNRDGNVLDLWADDFDSWTMMSVGIALCKKYGLSPEKSLEAYCSDAKEPEILRLFADLLVYFETYYKDLFGEDEYEDIYKKCKEIIYRERMNSPELGIPAVFEMNREYIVDIANRANRDVDNGEYESAITKAGTILEEVFCHAIEVKGEQPSEGYDICRLYNQIKELYFMHQDKDMDRSIKELLCGLQNIVNAIAKIRNKGSYDHRIGANRINISEHYARLFVNTAITMADFILSVEETDDSTS